MLHINFKTDFYNFINTVNMKKNIFCNMLRKNNLPVQDCIYRVNHRDRALKLIFERYF